MESDCNISNRSTFDPNLAIDFMEKNYAADNYNSNSEKVVIFPGKTRITAQIFIRAGEKIPLLFFTTVFGVFTFH